MVPQYQSKQNAISMNTKLLLIAAERDAALAERDRALSDRKAALDERDAVMQQRDAAIYARDNARKERDNIIAALHFHENTMNDVLKKCGPKSGSKRMHQVISNPPVPAQSAYEMREVQLTPVFPVQAISSEVASGKPVKQPKEPKKSKSVPSKISSKSQRKVKKTREDLNVHVAIEAPKSEYDDGQDLDSVKQIAFDPSYMPMPVCSCTGEQRQCYKSGNGGWQSSCCTTLISMYPLPLMPDKNNKRMAGRKMSGGVFSRLLTRVAEQGHDLRMPLDLKDYWAKHGTNRYITIK